MNCGKPEDHLQLTAHMPASLFLSLSDASAGSRGRTPAIRHEKETRKMEAQTEIERTYQGQRGLKRGTMQEQPRRAGTAR